MDDPNITMEEYIRLEEEKARRRAIIFNDALTSKAPLSYEPTISSLNNDEIDFRISFDESDDEDYTFERKDNGGLCFVEQIWVPAFGNVKTLIMDEAYVTKYSVHPGVDKMYYDLQDLYWWPGMKKDIVMYISKCLTYSKVKAEHQKLSGLLQQLEIPEWNYPRGLQDGKVCKTVHQRDRSKAQCACTDGQSERTIQTLEDMLNAFSIDFGGKWDTHLPLVDFSSRRKKAYWTKDCPGDYRQYCSNLGKTQGYMRSPEKLCKQPMKTVRVQYWQQSTIQGHVAYRLRLPEELIGIHCTFHMSKLKKCSADVNLHVLLEEMKVDNSLHFVEKPIETIDREDNKLKRSRIPIVNVRWNSRQGSKFTWE
ncbi:putative reverse transcriptase domain-containing protein [Tanacetum coccineum]